MRRVTMQETSKARRTNDVDLKTLMTAIWVAAPMVEGGPKFSMDFIDDYTGEIFTLTIQKKENER